MLLRTRSVELIQFTQCFNVRAVPGVRLHLLGIRTVMNIRGVGGDVSKVKSPLVYRFLDSKGEYVGFH